MLYISFTNSDLINFIIYFPARVVYTLSPPGKVFKKAETILLSVTLSRNRNMISASAILLIFHKIPVQIKNVRLSCRSFLRRHRRRNFPNCCWIQYDV